MDYHKKYLEYKIKYHLLKQQSQEGGMDPSPPFSPEKKPFSWGKIEDSPQLAADKKAARENRERIKAEQAEQAALVERELQVKREREERRLEKIRLEAERIRKEQELASIRLPPEMIEYIMEKEDINIERLIRAREDVEFKGIVDNFILEQLYSNIFSIENLIKIYNVIPELQEKMKPIILNKLKSKIDSGKLALSELFKLNLSPEFKMLVAPIINEAYNIKFSALPKFNPHMIDDIKLLYLVIHFLCDVLISLDSHRNSHYNIKIKFINEIPELTEENIEYVEYLSKYPFTETYSFYNLIGGIVCKRLGREDDEEDYGEFNFNNLLEAVIDLLEKQRSHGNVIETISLGFGKQNLFEFNFFN